MNLPPGITKPALARASLLYYLTAYWQLKPYSHIRRIVEKLENDSNQVVIIMPPGFGKPCFVGDLVLCADGAYKQLGDIRVGDEVITHLGRSRHVIATHDQGLLPTLRITTKSGRSTIAAYDHPFLTPLGWKRADELRPGTVLANRAQPTTCSDALYPIEAFRLAGYLVGDGSVSSGNANVTCFDPGQGEDIIHCAQALGFACSLPKRRGKYNLTGGIRPWLRATGLVDKTAHTKQVPTWVFTAPPDHIAQFIGAYFACDGSVNKRGPDGRTDICVEFYSVSRELLVGTQQLLLRLGIQSRLREKWATYKEGPHQSWRLQLTSQDNVARFIHRVPVFGVKAAKLAQWSIQRDHFDEQFFPDSVISTEETGLLPCRCLTVEEDATFTVDDFVVHNSTIVSQLYPNWYLGNHPNRNVLLISNTDAQAKLFLNANKEAMEHHEGWKETFPDAAPDPERGWSGAGLFLKWRRDPETGLLLKDWKSAPATQKDPAMAAFGVGGPVIGRRADVIIVDDPYSQDMARSDVQREEFAKWFKQTLLSRLKPVPWAKMVVCLTRWHPDDVVNWMLEQNRLAVEGS